MSFRQLSSNDTALPSITEFRVHFMSLCSEILPHRMAASICAFPISHSILGPAALGKKPSDIISHGVSTPPPSRQHWQNHNSFTSKSPWDVSPCQSLELWQILWLNWKRWKVVYIFVVSVVGSGAIVILFVTWGDWRGITSGMRGSDIFYWRCRIVSAGLEFWTLLLRIPLFCSTWFRLFRLSHSTSCCQLYWLAVMSLLSMILVFFGLNIPV